MKTIKLFFLLWFGVNAGLSAQADTTCAEPSVKELKTALHVLWNKTSCREITSDRRQAMRIVQQAADRFSHLSFAAYKKESEEKNVRASEESGILYCLKTSFDKVLKEVKHTNVKRGTTVIWHVYNMGYVVKTPTSCFAIDIMYKHAGLLVPYIDFLLVTHKHGDHYTEALFKSMEEAGKPVVTNFYDHAYLTKDVRTWTFGEVEVKTSITDHNAKLRNFVITYEINCGKSSHNCTILHVGDTFNAEQIRPTQPIDLFIPHGRVGLDMQTAIERVQPKAVLMSHMLELGHSRQEGGYRWSLETGIRCCENLNVTNAWLPVWGEKIVWRK